MNTMETMLAPLHDAWGIDSADGGEIALLPGSCANSYMLDYVSGDTRTEEAADAR
jgi:hypothetical protein